MFALEEEEKAAKKAEEALSAYSSKTELIKPKAREARISSESAIKARESANKLAEKLAESRTAQTHKLREALNFSSSENKFKYVLRSVHKTANKLRKIKKDELEEAKALKDEFNEEERIRKNLERDARLAARNMMKDNLAVENVAIIKKKRVIISPDEAQLKKILVEEENIKEDRSEVQVQINDEAKKAGMDVDDYAEHQIRQDYPQLSSETTSVTNVFFIESTDPPQYSFKQNGNKGYICNMITGACSIVLLSAVALGAAKLSGVFGGKKTKNKKNKMKTKKTSKKTSKKRRTKNHKMKMKIKKQSRKRTKGGELQLDDPYKNSEGPQY